MHADDVRRTHAPAAAARAVRGAGGIADGGHRGRRRQPPAHAIRAVRLSIATSPTWSGPECRVESAWRRSSTRAQGRAGLRLGAAVPIFCPTTTRRCPARRLARAARHRGPEPARARVRRALMPGLRARPDEARAQEAGRRPRAVAPPVVFAAGRHVRRRPAHEGRRVPILNLIFHSSEAIVGGSLQPDGAQARRVLRSARRVLAFAVRDLGAVPPPSPSSATDTAPRLRSRGPERRAGPMRICPSPRTFRPSGRQRSCRGTSAGGPRRRATRRCSSRIRRGPPSAATRSMRMCPRAAGAGHLDRVARAGGGSRVSRRSRRS